MCCRQLDNDIDWISRVSIAYNYFVFDQSDTFVLAFTFRKKVAGLFSYFHPVLGFSFFWAQFYLPRFSSNRVEHQ